MATTSTLLERTYPPEVRKLAQQLRFWRASPQRERRIPEAFWGAAVRLARTYGVSRISRALKFSYHDLQRRARGTRARRTRRPSQPMFIQLPAPALGTAVDQHGTLEVVHSSGSRLILRLPDAKPDELLVLVQAFLEHR
jgi:hypothetical protein